MNDIAAVSTQSSDPTAAPGLAYVGGNYVPTSEAVVSVFDFGLTRSDVTYDVAHVWQGSFFRLDAHISRFFTSLKALRMTIPHSPDELRGILHELVRRSGLRDVYVAMLCTRGRPPFGSRDSRLCENRFIAYAVPFVWLATPEQREKGMHAVYGSHRRISALSVDPTVKNYHHLDSVRSLFDAYDRGAQTVLLLDEADNVTEGPGFNAFAVIGNVVTTPDAGVLEGVTRDTVIQLARDLGYEVQIRPVSATEFLEADEVFVTSTGGGVMPVTRLEGRIFGNGVPGPITRKLETAYWQAHSDPRFSQPVDY